MQTMEKIRGLRVEYDSAPVLFQAKNIHIGHKGTGLEIPCGSYLEEIYSDRNPYIVIKKSTQSGISEYLMVRAFYRAEMRRNIFYVFPTYDLKNQFVRERVDKTLTYTQYYRDLISESETRWAESMSMKQIGGGTIAFVGSNTTNAFLSFPADDVIIDEVDNCHQDNLIMAEERQSASRDKTMVKVGNPTIMNYGIDYEYNKSDQKQWWIKCDYCGAEFVPDFFKHVVMQVGDGNYVLKDRNYKKGMKRDILPVCECGKPYDRFKSGRWIARKESEVSGYTISKMFSTQVKIRELVERFTEGLNNESVMQRFYNGDLGMAYTSSGAKISRQMLEECLSDYLMPDASAEPCVAGVDIGLQNNIIVSTYGEPNRVVFIGTSRDILETISIFKRYNVRCFVVDAQPERREAAKLCHRWKYGLMNFYGKSKRDIVVDPKNLIVNSNRTMALDAVKERIMTKFVLLPSNARNIDGFYSQMEASTRVYDEKREDYVWEHGSEPDHYHHAFAYMLIARRVMAMIK